MKQANNNLIFFLSDEHAQSQLGCYGSEHVQTPNLDQLAQDGTLFETAYCNSPICVPSRASLATGRYVHDIRFWDNGTPYDGTTASWAHVLKENGYDVISIGKLHYRGDDADENGFTEEIIPLHSINGVGDLLGLIREDMHPNKAAGNFAAKLGPGASDYTDYDLNIATTAQKWLEDRKASGNTKPFALFVSMVSPHFPLISPQKFFDQYDLNSVPMPRLSDPAMWPKHPVIDEYRRIYNYNDYFDQDRTRLAVTNYFGLCSYLDDLIGKVIGTLKTTGYKENSYILYASDHGESLGVRGLWGKSVMYEESVAVPMIISGPDIPAGKRCKTPVSLVDVFATAMDIFELSPSDGIVRPGKSLREVACAKTDDTERPIYSEYHASGSLTGHFMVRIGKWKYIAYPGYAPQLFDLEQDPLENADLGQSPEYADIRAECDAALRKIVDVEAANALAFSDQKARIEQFGGAAQIRERGSYAYSPPPGETTEFVTELQK
ncbi:sulfatase-like hydrolase/transferase [Amylibacter sp.]|nr:sulfatase-like hydrolase/transferase [Amylibacter sp.]